MDPALQVRAAVGLTSELDQFYQLCCDEETASTASSAAALSSLPCFTLSPDDEGTPEPAPAPASPAVSLPAPLLARIVHLHSICAESTVEASTSLYSVLLSRLVHLLPQSITPLLFRLSVVQLLWLLMLPPATTSASCQAFLSSHLYRLASLLLPPALPSSSVASALLRLVDALLSSGGPLGRSVCVNVRKYVEAWKDERERRRLQRQADDTTAYFAAGGEVDANGHTARAEARDREAADGAAEGAGVVVAGKRRRRIEPDPSVAALFPCYPTADEEDARATALIEQLRAEQKAALTERKLRAKGESAQEEWRREWRRWMDDEDEADAEERAETQAADAGEVRNNRLWRQWVEEAEWRPFMPSSLTESPPRSSRPARKRKEASESEAERKEAAAAAEEDEVLPLSAAELAQVEAAAASGGFSSSYFVPPPAPVAAVAQPSHFVHPSRAGAAYPPAFHQLLPALPFAPFEQPLHAPFVPAHAYRAGMQR